jgi:hypothetical protein
MATPFMSFKGFGQRQPTKTHKLVERAVHCCRMRQPEKLDQIFDNLPVKLNNQVLDDTLSALKEDVDSLGWLCGYNSLKSTALAITINLTIPSHYYQHC